MPSPFSDVAVAARSERRCPRSAKGLNRSRKQQLQVQSNVRSGSDLTATLDMAESNTAFAQIVRRKLREDLVTGDDANGCLCTFLTGRLQSRRPQRSDATRYGWCFTSFLYVTRIELPGSSVPDPCDLPIEDGFAGDCDVAGVGPLEFVVRDCHRVPGDSCSVHNSPG